ncbi:MAG: lysophospholipid acyltransferase family protein [Synergistetes bacterium]|nr:lysophospholipid acyltransferase family protein [Synergistota bacterium]MDW8191618.1 lysophospholipid acyltransferase family protein [Synergistota bacterium]
MSFLHWLFNRVRERALRSTFEENQRYGQRLGRLFYYLPLFLRRKKIALENISLAFGGILRDRRFEILKGLFEHLGMSVLEVMSLERMKAEELQTLYILEGLEHVKGGGIMVSAHFGNWELTLAYLSSLGLPINVIVRPPSDPFFAEYIGKIRKNFGAKLIPKDGMLRQCVRCLEKGEILVILVDQDEGPQGIFVPFMGRLSSTPRGAFTLSLRLNVPLIPFFTYREASLYHVAKFYPPIYPVGKNELELALTISSMIEEEILKRPSQWLWIHRRWKSKPREDTRG